MPPNRKGDKENNSGTTLKPKGQGFHPVLATQKRRGKVAAQQEEQAPLATTKQTARRQQHRRTTLSHRQRIRGDGTETKNEDNGPNGPSPNPPRDSRDPLSVDDCLALLKLRRPLESKTEFGLAEGIGTHLAENIKLSGLRKAREKSLLDMVKTLTHHLENREETIATWVSFADKVLSIYVPIFRSCLNVQCSVPSIDLALNSIYKPGCCTVSEADTHSPARDTRFDRGRKKVSLSDPLHANAGQACKF